MKQKAFFSFFEWLSLTQIKLTFLESESPTLRSIYVKTFYCNSRSSPKVFSENGVLKFFSKFTGRALPWSPFFGYDKSCIFIKKDVVVFLWTLEIFQNNYSIKQLFLKSCLVNTTRCLKYIWPFHPFYNIIHERGKNKMTNMNANKLVMLPKTS